jgi:hypothetical protein
MNAVVDSTGAHEVVIEHMNAWHRWRWRDDPDDDARPEFELLWDRKEECDLFRWNDMVLTRRDAEYVVECLQGFLPLESNSNDNP